MSQPQLEFSTSTRGYNLDTIFHENAHVFVLWETAMQVECTRCKGSSHIQGVSRSNFARGNRGAVLCPIPCRETFWMLVMLHSYVTPYDSGIMPPAFACVLAHCMWHILKIGLYQMNDFFDTDSDA